MSTVANSIEENNGPDYGRGFTLTFFDDVV